MSPHAQRVPTPTFMKKHRPQFRGKLLSLPDKAFLAKYKKLKLQSSTRTLSKDEMMKKILLSVRKQAARDRYNSRTVKRIKHKVWVEVHHQPKEPVILPGQTMVPQITVTKPDGQTCSLKDPNNYE